MYIDLYSCTSLQLMSDLWFCSLSFPLRCKQRRRENLSKYPLKGQHDEVYKHKLINCQEYSRHLKTKQQQQYANVVTDRKFCYVNFSQEVPTGKGEGDENCADSHENQRELDREDLSRDQALPISGGVHGFTHAGSEGDLLEDKDAWCKYV